jgi:2-methylcitrate dehydratase PrpD
VTDAVEPILDFAASTSFDSLPGPVVEITKAFVLDTCGLMVAGIRAPGCAEVLNQLEQWGGRGEASVFSGGDRLPAPAAAMANALLAHAFDFDDTHERGDMHGYAVVVPAVLAAAELVGNVSGKALITAIAVGIDLSYRMGVAIERYRGWHPTATCGVFGATFATALVAGLDRETMRHAAGIAYSLTAGNFQCILDGSLTKRTQPAFAARSGVEAMVFARRGITGAKEVFEGKFGFYPLYEAGEYDRDALVGGLGSKFETEQASMKPYPSCRFCHGAVDAVLEVAESRDLQPDDIDAITVTMPAEAYEYVGGPYQPGDSPQVSAQFSTAYNVAAAISRRRLGLDEFDAQTVLDPLIRALANRVETIATDDHYCFGPQDVTLRIRDGDVIERRIEIMKGHPENPMSNDERLAKVRDCVTYAGHAPALADDLAGFADGLARSAEPAAELSAILKRGTPYKARAAG